MPNSSLFVNLLGGRARVGSVVLSARQIHQGTLELGANEPPVVLGRTQRQLSIRVGIQSQLGVSRVGTGQKHDPDKERERERDKGRLCGFRCTKLLHPLVAIPLCSSTYFSSSSLYPHDHQTQSRPPQPPNDNPHPTCSSSRREVSAAAACLRSSPSVRACCSCPMSREASAAASAFAASARLSAQPTHGTRT